MASLTQLRPNSPAPLPIRVVVKLSEHALREGGTDARKRALLELRSAVPAGEFCAYFEGAAAKAAERPPFNRYVAVEASDRSTADELVRSLLRMALVEEAYVEAGPVPPPVAAADDPRSINQGYLDAAPEGIDARWAWALTDGAGVGFVDLEQGWSLDHEDLAGAGISIISGVNQDYHGHGTAVLGEVVAVDNRLGGVGIAPGASCRVVSQYRTATSYNTAAAILSAGDAMSPGDVLLLEAQTHYGTLRNLPVEVETAVFDAIRHVVDSGIVVVEAAGNGGNDLDAFRTTSNKQVLNRRSDDFRDSGAIMVGAASSSAPHSRLSFSCHGSRIDCYGWGQSIDTAGDGWRGTGTDLYTETFGGTSGASPMVAGAAVLLQSWRRNRSHVYTPARMRALLSASSYNTASANPASDRIGVMPNLRAIIEGEIRTDGLRRFRDKYLSAVYILFGLIDDSPGVIWVPGKGPIPVDPDWGPLAEVSPAKRDLLAALAVTDIAETVSEPGARRALNAAAVGAMHDAVARMGRQV